MMFRRDPFHILEAYIQSVGDMQQNYAQLKTALQNINNIIDFAEHKVGAALEAEQAEQISEVGLQWLEGVHQGGNMDTLRDQAKQALD
ncbi:MAG: hypothetical protein ACTJHW_02695 [Paenalcaligenes sp.]|uniref:hypothetical protein n=1 Tax=Paenalcaligenes suwonensis TaxID=1202713 RepID=UPI001409D54A|nr:hypothetical protein [Paenalcaligenes suwonensis]NHC60195.1 hypothetical protein [Paenalcaligenes suwonensis]